MRDGHPVATVTMVGFLFLALAGPAMAADEPTPGISFRFAPSLGTHRESLRITRTLQVGEAAAKETVTSFERQVTVRETGEGFYFDVESLDGMGSLGEDAASDPLMTRIEGALLRFVVNPKGQASEVRGYAEAVEELKAEIGAERVSRLGMRAADPENLSERALELWQLRIGDFAGNRYAIGEILVTKQTMDLPTGDVATYHMVMRVGPAEPCGRVQCARIELAFASDPGELADFVNATPQEAREVLGGKDRSGAEISGGGSRLLELDTMRLHEEELVRSAVWTTEIPGQGALPIRLEERRESYWSYGSEDE